MLPSTHTLSSLPVGTQSCAFMSFESKQIILSLFTHFIQLERCTIWFAKCTCKLCTFTIVKYFATSYKRITQSGRAITKLICNKKNCKEKYKSTEITRIGIKVEDCSYR